jgi:hypothetical protein
MDQKHIQPRKVQLPSTAADALASCEVNCVAECCGFGAFDLEAKYVAAWLEKAGSEKGITARNEFQQTITLLMGDPGVVHLVDLNEECTHAEGALWYSMVLDFLYKAGVPHDKSWSAPVIPPAHLRDHVPNFSSEEGKRSFTGPAPSLGETRIDPGVAREKLDRKTVVRGTSWILIVLLVVSKLGCSAAAWLGKFTSH